MPFKSSEARRAYNAAQYQRNREKRIAEAVAWGRANPEKYNANHRRWKVRNPEKVLLQRCRDNARHKGIEFSLEISDIVIPEVCPVFGVPMDRGGSYAPSVDRIYNDQGYTKENIVIVSWRANRLKKAMTMGEIQALATFYAKYDW